MRRAIYNKFSVPHWVHFEVTSIEPNFVQVNQNFVHFGTNFLPLQTFTSRISCTLQAFVLVC